MQIDRLRENKIQLQAIKSYDVLALKINSIIFITSVFEIQNVLFFERTLGMLI